MQTQDLKPYCTLLFAKGRGSASALGADVLADATEKLGIGDSGDRVLVHREAAFESQRMHVAWLYYREERRPSWSRIAHTAVNAPKDVLHHLLLVLARNRHVAIHASDSGARGIIGRHIGAADATGALAGLKTIKVGRLNAAFATGTARTLWLSGVHRSVPVKPDSKILAGVDLGAALDPLADQSFFFSAARCQAPLGAKAGGHAHGAQARTVGITPRASRAWTGPSRTWEDFFDDARTLVELLIATSGQEARPLPVLAAPIDGIEDVADAFEASLLPPWMLSDVVATDEEDEVDETSSDKDDADGEPEESVADLAERWGNNGHFEVVDAVGAELHVDVCMGDAVAGRLHLEPEASARGVRWKTQQVGDAADPALLGQAKRLCRDPSLLSVRYASGHAYADGGIFLMAFRDEPFLRWEWAAFDASVDIGREKPTDPGNSKKFRPDLIGDPTQDPSLFGWVWRTFGQGADGKQRGWLTCDDRAQEIADFVHLDTDGDEPCVTLIHVKGAKRKGAERELSVAEYEVVVGQAVKNVRWLEHRTLAKELEAGANKQVAKATWHNGVKQNQRAGMIAAAQRLGGKYARKVVVVQPRNTKTAYDAARDGQGSGVARLRQLDALLLGAQADCRALGANLVLVGAK